MLVLSSYSPGIPALAIHCFCLIAKSTFNEYKVIKKAFPFFILFWAIAYLAYSQSDSLGAQELRIVEIFGRPVTRYAAGSRITSLDSALLKTNNAGQLGEVLQFRVPIYLKNYGPGSLATAAFRGTSASQTAVLWHGFNINQPTLGQTDFSVIPVTAFSQVDVQYGSAGANYGTGAVGGAILLSSPASWGSGLKLRLQQDIGSFNHAFTSLSGSYGTGKIYLKTNVFRQSALNDFEYINFTKAGQPHEKQVNAATNQKGFTQDLDLKLGNHHTLSFRGWYTHNDSESQPNMTQANTQARRQDENLRLMAEWNHATDKIGKTAVRVAYFKDYMLYTDESTHSVADINTFQAQVEHTIIVQDKFTFKTGAEAQHFSGENSGYAQPVQEYRAALFGWMRYNPVARLNLSLNLRQSFVAGFNPPLTPTAGINFYLLDNAGTTLVLKGNMSRGYRAPTLNDRFWPPGNAALKPENSWNYETGLQHTYKTNNFCLTSEATVYRLLVDNYIQWVPSTENGLWSPFNLKKVVSTGGELSSEASYTFPKTMLHAGFLYSYTRSEQKKTYLPTAEPLNQQLYYVPQHTLRGYTTMKYHTWLLSANVNFTGTRFTTPENDQWLPPYTLLNMALGKSFRINNYQFEIIGKVNNATNAIYQTLEYYAMPQRHYALSLRFNLN